MVELDPKPGFDPDQQDGCMLVPGMLVVRYVNNYWQDGLDFMGVWFCSSVDRNGYGVLHRCSGQHKKEEYVFSLSGFCRVVGVQHSVPAWLSLRNKLKALPTSAKHHDWQFIRTGEAEGIAAGVSYD